jgi:hypothetical protein
MRRERQIDREPPRIREGSHRAYQTPIAVEPQAVAEELAILRRDAKTIVARALAMGWVKPPSTI